MSWNPEQYHKFQAERFAPFEDLARLVQVRTGLQVVDLGCGTGELTRRLADMLPESDVLGIDSSPNMLVKAQQQVRPGLRVEQADLATISGRWDLVFSNAAIHWVDDHAMLIPRLFGMVRPGGQLVIQQPANHFHPSHQLIIATAEQEPFRSALQGWTRAVPVLPVRRYAELLFAAGGTDLVVFEKVYPHVLPNAAAIVEWTKGTALLPYLERLPEALHAAFLQRYHEQLQQLLPDEPVFFGFHRILFAATKPV